LPSDLVQAWGWRLPFIAGLIVAPVGFYLRGHVDETPGYMAEAATEAPPTRPLFEALSQHGGTVLSIMGIVVVWTVAGYTFGAFLVNFATRVLKIDPVWAYSGTLVGALVNIAIIPTAGLVSDKFGRKPFLLVAAGGFFLCAVPIFAFMDHVRSGAAMLICTTVAGAFSGLFSGTAPTFLCELLPTRVRYTALSVGYNAAVMLFGGFAPFICTLLVKQTGTNVAPGFYVMAAALVSFIAIARAPDRSGAPLQ
jgi:MHS family proline/betaine transporter-like MFS transporter